MRIARSFIAAAGLLLIVGSVCAAEQRPNVLFIIADDLADRLACYGDTVAVTPNLDKLAADGVLFANNFCQYPSCGPSRSSMLTGLYPWEAGHMKRSNIVVVLSKSNIRVY